MIETYQKGGDSAKFNKNLEVRYSRRFNSLNLSNCSSEWQKALNKKEWSHLKALHLNGCDITSQKITSFVSLDWPNLKFLFLQNNNIGSQGMKILSKANLPVLKQFRIGNSKLGNEGVKHLSKAKWPEVREIQIFGNHILDNGSKLTEGIWKKAQSVGISWVGGENCHPIMVLAFVAMPSPKGQIIRRFQNWIFDKEVVIIFNRRFVNT